MFGDLRRDRQKWRVLPAGNPIGARLPRRPARRWGAPPAVTHHFCRGILVIIFIFSTFGSALMYAKEQKVLRVGYFPNITHAQAIVGRANGVFQEVLGENTPIDWKIFNAGPSTIEALFAGELDIAYVGPSPAVNGYVKSGGEALRVIAGAASGGAALVVRVDAGISKPEDFKSKTVASPQLGNTQDVALKSWIFKNGLKPREIGGDVRVIPLTNADQVTLFLRKEIDAAWTVEPWVSILVQDAGARVFLEEAELWMGGFYATTLVIARTQFLKEHPEVAEKFLRAHVKATEWVNANPEEAKRKLNQEIEKLTRKKISEEVLDSAFKRVGFTYASLKDSVFEQAKAAYRVGYLKKEPDLSGLYDLKLLEEILWEARSRSKSH